MFDDTVDMRAILLRLAAFFRDESCGQCVPCRVGTVRQEESLHRLTAGTPIGSVRSRSRTDAPGPGCEQVGWYPRTVTE